MHLRSRTRASSPTPRETTTGLPSYCDPPRSPPRARRYGASIIPLVSSQVGAEDFLNGISKFGPGSAIAEHFHNCDEAVLVITGSAVAHIDGVAHHVGPGDASFIAGTHHQFENASDSEEMHIFWTHASIDATRTVVAIGVTTRIDEEHGAAVKAVTQLLTYDGMPRPFWHAIDQTIAAERLLSAAAACSARRCR